MLRTAQEIIDETFERAKKDALVSEIYIMAVNEAMIQAVWEVIGEANRMVNSNSYDSYSLAWGIIDKIDPTRNEVKNQSI